MPRPTDTEEKGFLGGGPRFNQAGNNAPLPGEKVADADTPAPFGGPKVWIGVVVVILLIGILWMIFGNGLPGTQHVGGRGGVSPADRPSDNPDQSSQ